MNAAPQLMVGLKSLGDLCPKCSYRGVDNRMSSRPDGPRVVIACGCGYSVTETNDYMKLCFEAAIAARKGLR